MENETKYYTFEDDGFETENLNIALAKKTIRTTMSPRPGASPTSINYFIKVNQKTGLLMNPAKRQADMEYGFEHSSSGVYKKVNKLAFDCYIKYLKTKKQIHLQAAEKESV